MRKDRFGDTVQCRYPPWYPFHEEILKDRKIEKYPKTCKCCHVRIASGNLSCDQCGCFCRRRLVNLDLHSVAPSQLNLSSFKWARSTLEGWKISACSHLLCSTVFHIQQKLMQLFNSICTWNIFIIRSSRSNLILGKKIEIFLVKKYFWMHE